MSGLAHYLEDRGISTTLIALVRLHAEISRPPRALWVPFELGRPFGGPGNPEFQTRVVRRVLALLERDDGPVLLEDFDAEEPGTAGDPEWRAPNLAQADSLLAEIAALRPIYDAAFRSTGRTTVGVSKLEPEVAAEIICRFDSDDPLANPRPDLARVQVMRYAVDDLKAFYLEAAAFSDGNPSSRQLNDWLWQETRFAKSIWSLLLKSFDHPDTNRRHAVWWLVPDAYVDRATVERIWAV